MTSAAPPAIRQRLMVRFCLAANETKGSNDTIPPLNHNERSYSNEGWGGDDRILGVNITK